jgi:hypothetical protein
MHADRVARVSLARAHDPPRPTRRRGCAPTSHLSLGTATHRHELAAAPRRWYSPPPMRRARASQAQLALPGLAEPEPVRDDRVAPAPDLPEPARALTCARCGWYRAPAVTCPMCQPRPADRPR